MKFISDNVIKITKVLAPNIINPLPVFIRVCLFLRIIIYSLNYYEKALLVLNISYKWNEFLMNK